MDYPRYARSERIADGTMHLLGVLCAVGGAGLLMMWSFGETRGDLALALVIYGAALVATFGASAFYHMTPWEHLRPTLRRIDHAAIFLKIAGTYTPLVVMIGSFGSYMLLALIWALAVLGVIRKIFFWRTPCRYDTLMFLFMGWLSLLLIWSLVPLVPVATICLIAVGGLLYSVGVVFYSWQGLKYSMAIWHAFVLTASLCFYGAIALGVFHVPS